MRMCDIRGEERPLLVWENDDFLFEEAQARAERLADWHVPVIIEGWPMSIPVIVEAHKLTVREFHALEPVLGPAYRYELLDGRIVVMPPGNPHAVVLDELNAQFSR